MRTPFALLLSLLGLVVAASPLVAADTTSGPDDAPARVLTRAAVSKTEIATVQAACDSACGSPWSAAGGLSFGLGEGNSEFLDLRVFAEVKRKPTPWGFAAKITYVYGTRDGDTSADNWRGVLRVDRKVGSRVYVFGRAQGDRDDLADLEYRINAVAGVGIQAYKTTRTKLDLEAGFGAVIEKRDGQAETTDPSAYFGADFEHCWANGRRVTAALDFSPNLGDFDLSLTTFEMHFLSPLAGVLQLDVGLRLDHVIDPPAAEELDVLFTVGLRVEV